MMKLQNTNGEDQHNGLQKAFPIGLYKFYLVSCQPNHPSSYRKWPFNL